MGWMDLFIAKGEEVEEEVVETEETTEEVEPPKTVVTATGGSVNSDIFTKISKVLDDANLDGYDYYEFAKAVESQKDIIPSEQARYSAMFAAGVPAGLSLDILNSSAKHYLSILGELEASSKEDIESKISEQVDANIAKADSITTAMNEKSEQIKQLTAEINDLHKEKTEVLATAENNKASIQIIANDFDTTINVFKNRINDDITKINKYLTQEKSDG